MKTSERIQAVLDLICGDDSASEIAQRIGATEDELETWKASYLAGLRAGEARRGRKARFRLARPWLVASAGLAAALGIGFWTVRAQSQQAGCTQVPQDGLVTFCPDTPAVAGEVNKNTTLLHDWINTKVGPVTDPNVTIADPNDLYFGSTSRQMINLYSNLYAIGVQPYTLFMRTGGTFQWYVNGTYSPNANDAGTGGTELMKLSQVSGASELDVAGNINAAGTVQAGYEIKTCNYSVSTTTKFSSCSCPAGKYVISGGIYCGSGYVAHANWPLSNTAWQGDCTLPVGGGDYGPSSIRIICARIQ